MPKDDLSPRQRKFVMSMLMARRIEDAAKAAGVTERTAYRWLNLPAVKAALAQALDAAMGQATRRVVQEMGGAVDTLKEIHADPEQPAGSRVSAARALLESGPKLREALDLAERLAELERSLSDGP